MQPLRRTVWRHLKKLKMELLEDPAIVLLSIYPKDAKLQIQRDTCTLVFIATLSTIVKLWKESKGASSDKWIKKKWYICTMEYYSVIKKNETLPFETMWMELESIMLRKSSQSEKGKYHMTSLICGI